MTQTCQRKVPVLIALVMGFGFVMFLKMPVARYTEDPVSAMATKLPQSMQSARPWLPLGASKAARVQFMQPRVRMQSLILAQPPNSLDKLDHTEIPITQVSNLSPAAEKRVEKKFIREIAPALASAAAVLEHGKAAHAGEAGFIAGVSFTMFGMVFFGLAIGFILLRIDDIFGERF